ncbi:transferase family domain-containing protein [Trichoderma breve]|uniref:Transferase family domain-containing protein n=1 Tax=Trichoderma breve TaxID=2034170 RepID=A0A9W9EDJ8_9HYPO|nr:transferase family domain-containing protein [Trichoderma breve]KAJ4864807.1 transferase family domain-containing protein [Trichoderma breve]
MSDKVNVVRLTPLDVIMPPTYAGVLLTFETTQSTHVIENNLQHGIDKLVTAMPWLAGRVYRTAPAEGNLSLELRWSQDGTRCTLFNKGSIPNAYLSNSDAGMSPEVIPANIWPVPFSLDDETWAAGVPVFSTSFFQFADKQGVGLCICVHHNVVDASGLSHIITLWAKYLSEDLDTGLILELDSMGRLSKALNPQLEALSSQSKETLFEAHPEYSTSPPALPTEFVPSACKLFRIPITSINETKTLIKDHTASDPSTNTTLCALLWSTITAARRKRNPALTEQTSKLIMAVNGRCRIGHDFSTLNHPYLSNLILYSLASFSSRDLIAAGDSKDMKVLAQICASIAESKSLDSINAKSIAEVYRLVESVDRNTTIFPGWDLFGSRDLTVTSWADLPLYEMDFGPGLGRPQHIRAPYSPADGVCLIMPRKRSDQTAAGKVELLDVMVMLRQDDMDALLQSWLGKSLVAVF